MVVYLHSAHAIGMERLALLMDELFSLSISEGAISNILARARQPLLDATATIEKVVLASPVICSDETSVRVKGKNWWEWVFIGTPAVLHVIKRSRGKAVVAALFGAIQPEVWVSDMLGSQCGHGVMWQVCPAPIWPSSLTSTPTKSPTGRRGWSKALRGEDGAQMLAGG
jgi:transposase